MNLRNTKKYFLSSRNSLLFFAFTILLFSFNFNTAEAAKIGVPINNTGLVGYWPFDNIDTTGTTSRDKSGNGFNGTMAATQSIVDGGIVGQAMNFVGDDVSESAAVVDDFEVP